MFVVLAAAAFAAASTLVVPSRLNKTRAKEISLLIATATLALVGIHHTKSQQRHSFFLESWLIPFKSYLLALL